MKTRRGEALQVRIRHAWWQKHPTGRDHGPDFKWYPAPPSELDALARLQPRTSGAMWFVSPDRFLWVRKFRAHSSSSEDPRAYEGLVVTVLEPLARDQWSRLLPGALAELDRLVPAAAPHPPVRSGSEQGLILDVGDPTDEPIPLGREAGWDLRERAREWARVVLGGGDFRLADSARPGLVAFLGVLLSWLPARQRTLPRGGRFDALSPKPTPPLDQAGERVALYLSRSWENASEFATRVWSCLHRLIDRERIGTLADLFELLDHTAAAFSTKPELRRLESLLSRAGIGPCKGAAVIDGSAARDNWNAIVHWWVSVQGGDREAVARVVAWRELVSCLRQLQRAENSDASFSFLRALKTQSLLQREVQEDLVARAIERLAPLASHLASTGTTATGEPD